MHDRLRPLLVALVATAAAPAFAQSNLNVYVALGDSLTAGFVNNSLLETHQRNSFPALIARQAGSADFQQPLVGEPGIPAETVLVQLTPQVVLAPKASAPGAPTNAGLGRPFNNLGVPGATAVDLLTRTGDQGGFHDLVLRGRGTAIDQARSLSPTFITLWAGNGDVVTAVVRGRAVDGLTLTPAATFRVVYGQIVEALRGISGASIVAANLPDPTQIPFARTVQPVVVNPATNQPVLVSGQTVPLIGPDGPLASGSLVTLAATSLLAQGIGIPTALGGRGTPLPDEVILDPGEIATIRDRVAAYNQAIRDVCQAASIPVLDAHARFDEAATTGWRIAGITFTNAFLTGGLFSNDGVHPTEAGYALIANEFIRVINANGGSVPEVDLAPFLGVGAQTAASSSRARAIELSEETYEDLLAIYPTLN
jgi:lysophospholipase L1-like esterase